MEHRWARAAWGAGFGAVLVGPVALRLGSAPTVPLWSQLAVVTGLLAFSTLAVAAVLPCRVRSLTSAFGIEAVLGMHRWLGTATAALVLVHLACVVAADPANVALLDPASAGPAARAAVGAAVGLGAVVALAVLRSRLRGSYETWRWVHLALAVAVLGLSVLHVWWLGHLVTEPAMRAALVVVVAGVLGVFAHRWGRRAGPDPAAEFVVRDVRPETPTVSTLVLAPRQGRHSAAAGAWGFAPGQFAWLRLDRSVTAEEHPFTIASSADDGRSVEFTVRHRGDFTDRLRGLRPGEPVWVDGPHGAFTPDPDRTAGAVMIAAGVGVAPMMSMLRTAADRGDQRPYRLVVVAADHDELLFRSELAVLRRRLDLEVTEVLRRPSVVWAGHTGEIGAGLLTAVLAGERHRDLDYFLCGPPALVADALDALDAVEVPTDRIHTEQFDLV
jgi:predicted ferric reductase